MRIFRVGDTQKAICHSCKGIQDAIFGLRDVPLSDGGGLVKNVLVGICPICDDVILLPHQSTPLVKQHLDTRRKAIETRVPAHMVDILNVVSVSLGVGTDFAPTLLKFYLHQLSSDLSSTSQLAIYLQSELAKGKSQKRISIKGQQVADDLQNVKIGSSLISTSDVLRAIVLKINDDVLQHPKPDIIALLKNVAKAFV